MDVERLSRTRPGLKSTFKSIKAEFQCPVDEHLISLKPLLVTVCFEGALPRQIAHQPLVRPSLNYLT